MIDSGLARERLRRLPPIRRARLWRLYAEDGRRFLDFWQDEGRSILGAKGTGIGTAAKAALDTGLTRPFPSVREARLEKELLRRYPGYSAVRLFGDEARALAAARPLLGPGEELRILKPFGAFLESGAEAGPDGSGGAAPNVAPPRVALPRVALPRLPCPETLGPAALLFSEAATAEAVAGDLLPPLVLACAQRALSEYDRFAVDYTEALWRRVDRRLGPHFLRRGPYLLPRLESPAGAAASDHYDELFDAALGAGVLLSPLPELPSMVPGDFDDGELARLAKALEKLKA